MVEFDGMLDGERLPHALKHQGEGTAKLETIRYYDENASRFAASTVDVEFSPVQERFEALLDPGAKVLDFGCGSGRDAKRFIQDGFEVVASDGSSEMCRIAESFIGRPVRNELFHELTDVDTYDGIWACSSILHLPKSELSQVLVKMERALKTGGITYTSFKFGTFEGMRNGRYFTDFTEPAFREFLESVPGLRVEQAWTSADVRPGREEERWLNLILRKV